MADGVVLGVDLGTTATKVVAVNAAAEICAETERGYPLRQEDPTPNGAGEPAFDSASTAVQDPSEVTTAAFEAVRECATECAQRGLTVRALAFTGAMHTLLGLDSSGSPCTPSLSWADTRATAQAAELRDPSSDRGVLATTSDLHSTTGTPVHPFAPLVKLAWYREHGVRADRWCGLKDYVLDQFTGRLVTDHSMASGTGLLELERSDWCPRALQVAGITREQLPELVEPTAELALSGSAAERTGLPADLPVVAGGGDGPLANLGTGAIRPGSAALSVGTSGALRVTVDSPGVDKRGRTFCYFLAEGLWVTGGAVSNGGIAAQWAAEVFDTDLVTLLEEARHVPTGARGLFILPYLLGERAPWWDPDPRGMVLGLRREHGRAEMTRAILEGVGQHVALIRDAVRECGTDLEEIRATGGAFRGPVWGEVLAAALESELRVAEDTAGSGLGAALLGHRALGNLDDLHRAAELVPAGEVQPYDPQAAHRLSASRPLVEQAYRALRELTEQMPT